MLAAPNEKVGCDEDEVLLRAEPKAGVGSFSVEVCVAGRFLKGLAIVEALLAVWAGFAGGVEVLPNPPNAAKGLTLAFSDVISAC